jgi:signal transduction histidine kinase
MRPVALRHHGLSFLPEFFAGTGDGRPERPLSRFQALLLLTMLVPPVVLPLYLDRVVYADATFHQHLAHSLIEGFCGLMALVVFYILHQEYLITGTRRLRWMAYGFLVLGVLDLFHALSGDDSNLFVWLRATAAFGGALFLALSLRQSGTDPIHSSSDATNARMRAGLVALGAVIFGLVSFLVEPWIPEMAVDGRFSFLALAVNGTAGAMYFMVGFSFLRGFRRNRENVLLVLAVAMFLFAESEVLVFFSHLWDVAWWAWHVIRTVIFAGILVGIAHEFTENVRELQESHASLLESEKLASLGEMAAGIAHEIRNPIGTLTNSVGLLREAQLSPEETGELLDILEKEVNRLNHIVSDTLAFAHPRSDRYRPLRIEAVVEEALHRLEHRHPGVRVERTFAPTLPPVFGDAVQLHGVVWNVVDNAISAMDGRGTLRVSAAAADPFVELAVEDTGRGIPEEVRAQLFKPFFSTKPGGTGLGLSIVKRIVTRHGGEVKVQSEVGRGTRVTISLPATEHLAAMNITA